MNVKKFLKGYKKTFITLSASLDAVLGVMSLGVAACAITVSRFVVLRIIGVYLLLFLIIFAWLGILLVRSDPKTKNWKLKRVKELPMISKARCIVIPSVLFILGIFLWVDLFKNVVSQ